MRTAAEPVEGGVPLTTREVRYGHRELLWAESHLERVRKCGRVVVRPGGPVLRVRDGIAGFAGLSTCGSVWADPVCNAKIMSRRAIEIQSAVGLHQSGGGQVVMLTLTMQHRKGQPLSALWDALGYAWGKVTSGKYWVAEKVDHGLVGYLRAVECTIGCNGWHPHVHVLLFMGEDFDAAGVDRLHASMFARWSRALARKGIRALAVAQEAHLVTGPADEKLAEYLTKATDRKIGLEFTWSQGKRTRKALGTEPAWVLLDEVAEGDADSLDLWHEYEHASKSRRMHTWSQGLRDLLALGVEKSDEEIAAEELGSADDDLVTITTEGWSQLVDLGGIAMAGLLSAAEAGGLTAARTYLDARRIDYRLEG